MSLNDFIKTQERIRYSVIPSAIQGLLETQRRLKENIYTPKVLEFLESQQNWKNIIPHNPFKDISSVINNSALDSYFKSFNAIENATKYFASIESVPSKLKFTYTNYDFLNFEEDTSEEEIKEVETVFVEQTKSIKRIITDIYKDNSNLLKVEPRQFEEIIAEMLYAKGFEVQLTKQTRDNGYDILALKVLENNFALKFLVECKRYKKEKVGVDIIRSFKEVIQTEKANKGIIVTTSYFTKDAQTKRKETPYLLDYKDKDDVLLWVAEYMRR